MRADLLFTGGAVFTAPAATSVRADVAMAGGRVVAVGPPGTLGGPGGVDARETVDLTGRLLVPGFQDAHVHPTMGGVSMLRCDLHGVADAADSAARVRAYATAHPERPWVLGSGWSMDHYPGGTPTRQVLDELVPDRPAYLINRDGHGAWVNTRALELAGVTASTPDPADGRVERESDGAPAGTLHEGAMVLLQRVLPPVTADEQRRALLAAQARLHALGITAWQDAAVGDALGQPDVLPLYLRLDREGLLTARVTAALWWQRERGGEQVEELVERRAAAAAALAAGGRVRATTVKIMQDGVAENFTAAMTAPYLDRCGHPTANSGLSFIDPEALRTHVTRLDAEGFSVHVHALGDRAVREALDAVAAAREANGPTPGRHHLAHLQVVHPDDVPRFAALRVSANLQPLWAVHEPQMDELTIPFLGGELAGWQYPFGDLHRAGAHLVAGSDWPVSDADPLAGIHVAVNRVAPAARGTEPFRPDQALDLATTLTAYTAGSAHVNHLDDGSGRIAPGAPADLAVLDRDVFATPPDEIGSARVLATYVGGALVSGGT